MAAAGGRSATGCAATLAFLRPVVVEAGTVAPFAPLVIL